MNTKKQLNNILNKFPKTELEKVELNARNDLKAYERELDKGRDDLMQYATDAREAISKGKRELNRLDAVKKVAIKISNDVAKKAVDLGVDIPEVKEIRKAISAYEQQRKTLTKVLK
jgi:uncharacterized membrane protein YkoI